MAVYKIEWKSAAYHELKNLARSVISRILQTVETLVHDPIPSGARKLHGADRTYRPRVGDFRIIYELALPERVVTIMRVRHRKDAYRSVTANLAGTSLPKFHAILGGSPISQLGEQFPFHRTDFRWDNDVAIPCRGSGKTGGRELFPQIPCDPRGGRILSQLGK